jgi:hypothetical protein
MDLPGENPLIRKCLRLSRTTRFSAPPFAFLGLPAIQQFLAWVERAGYQDFEDAEPITVAACIETLQRQAASPRSNGQTVRGRHPNAGCCFPGSPKRLKANARPARRYQSHFHTGKMVTPPSTCFGGDRRESVRLALSFEPKAERPNRLSKW